MKVPGKKEKKIEQQKIKTLQYPQGRSRQDWRPVSWLYNQVAKKGADKIPCFKRGKYWFFIPEKTDEWIEAGKQ